MQSGEKKFLPIFKCVKYLEMLELSDGNLQTDDGCNFDIHRFALVKRSDYFKRMFIGIDDKRRRKFHITGISGECLSDILCYIYSGDILITESNVADLIIGADYLLLDDLQMKIKGNIEDNLTEVNCLGILRAAHQISDEHTFRKCFRFIQIRFKVIMRCEKNGLTDLPLDILRRILSNRSLWLYNDETVVWQAIVAWTQRDIPHRMRYVPQLLLTLAMEDVGEDLATEILQHEIVSENCLMKGLVEITSTNELPTNLDGFFKFFRSYSNRFTEPIIRHRIPFQLFVAWSDDGGEMNLYVTYDENTDLWRKLTELRLWPDVLIAIGHNMYIFNMRSKTCMNFDLSAMDWVRMERFSNIICLRLCIVATDAYIYVLGDMSFYGWYTVEVYDTEDDEWRTGDKLHDISHIAAVAIENKIYVVGKSKSSDAMMTQMLDPDTEQWSILSPPTVYHTEFSLVAYHQKIYLIGGSDAEVFSPALNLWKKLPGDSCERSSPKAMVINDRIIVTDEKGYYECWNNAKECFEELIKNDTLEGLPLQFSRFCTVNDTDTIKLITKQNRDPEMNNNYINRKEHW